MLLILDIKGAVFERGSGLDQERHDYEKNIRVLDCIMFCYDRSVAGGSGR
jgi:hypothetical protein